MPLPATNHSSPPKLVAFDLDGTILEGGELIREEVLAALRAIAERGVKCVTATGRPYDFQLELFARHGIGVESPVLHALIGDEREIWLRDGAGAVFQPHTIWNDALRARWTDLFPVAMAMLAKAEQEAARRGMVVERLLTDEIAFARGLPTLRFQNPADAALLELWVIELLAEQDLPLACNRNVRLLQIFDRLVGKGPVLAELAQHLGMDAGDVLALGDSSNDYSMLDGRLGFRSGTFANAEPELKEMVALAGGYVASLPAGLGVVECFAHFGLLSGEPAILQKDS